VSKKGRKNGRDFYPDIDTITFANYIIKSPTDISEALL